MEVNIQSILLMIFTWSSHVMNYKIEISPQIKDSWSPDYQICLSIPEALTQALWTCHSAAKKYTYDMVICVLDIQIQSHKESWVTAMDSFCKPRIQSFCLDPRCVYFTSCNYYRMFSRFVWNIDPSSISLSKLTAPILVIYVPVRFQSRRI